MVVHIYLVHHFLFLQFEVEYHFEEDVVVFVLENSEEEADAQYFEDYEDSEPFGARNLAQQAPGHHIERGYFKIKGLQILLGGLLEAHLKHALLIVALKCFDEYGG